MCTCSSKTSSKQEKIKIVRVKAVQKKTGLSRSTIWRKVKDGSFPAPVKLSSNCIGFFEHEVDEFLLSLPRVSTINDRS